MIVLIDNPGQLQRITERVPGPVGIMFDPNDGKSYLTVTPNGGGEVFPISNETYIAVWTDSGAALAEYRGPDLLHRPRL